MTVVLSTTRELDDLDGPEDLEGARWAEERPPARPPLRPPFEITWEEPKSMSSTARAGGTKATLESKNAAARTVLAVLLALSSRLMLSAVEEDCGVLFTVAKPETPETPRKRSAAVKRFPNIFNVSV